MKKSKIEKRNHSPARREKNKLSAYEVVLLSALALNSCAIFFKLFGGTQAITLPEPFGIRYFDSEPSLFQIAHENYHKFQKERDGAWQFYLNYIFGKGCLYEAQAGEDPTTHKACEIFWMYQPTESEIATQAEIVQWYISNEGNKVSP
jgi:hypothetical protein